MRYVILALGLLLPTQLHAGEIPPRTTQELIDINNGLQQISQGHMVSGVSVQYGLDPEVTYAIAVDLSRLKPFMDGYQIALHDQALRIVSLHPENNSTLGAAELQKESDKLMAETHIADLIRIKWESLKIGPDPQKQNQIPPNALALIMSIVDQPK